MEISHSRSIGHTLIREAYLDFFFDAWGESKWILT